MTSQNVTNPALGPVGLDALATGADASEAVAAMVAADAFPEYRQLSVVSASGGAAAHSGSNTLGTHTSVTGDGAVVAGNLLATESVAHAMMAGYTGSRAETFEQRLLDGYAVALEAGGEEGPVRSVGLVVVEDVPWAVTDLRVDDADDPFGELRRLWRLWAPQKAAYRVRGIDPRQAPSYGVPGDL
ncbi:DUF1028 domain-containing protein [Prauserella halophila]|uniref:DUF1028 domain-containing protein n=1 Tax=Prauserella halophila TaxID=185641 RepID=A0ABP4GQV2_9PSEU